MVAQQVAADKYIKDNYEVLNTVTFGSPLIKGFTREGMLTMKMVVTTVIHQLLTVIATYVKTFGATTIALVRREEVF